MAKVTTIYKDKDSRDDTSNYRPVFVISFVAKILEKYLKRQLMEDLQCHDFNKPDQSAYLHNHSTRQSCHDFIKPDQSAYLHNHSIQTVIKPDQSAYLHNHSIQTVLS